MLSAWLYSNLYKVFTIESGCTVKTIKYRSMECVAVW